MLRDMMVEILAGVGLVVHEKALIAKPEILDEDRVAGHVRSAIVGDFEAPEPGVEARVKPERNPMPDAGRRSLPDIAIVRRADAKSCLGTDHGQNRRLRSAHPQIDPPHAVGDRRGERLIDHDPTVRRSVLDGEDGAGRQDAH